MPRDYDSNLLNRKIDLLCKKYTFLRKKSIGKSVKGQDIFSIRLGNTENLSLYSAAFHGSEHITTNVLMMWLEDLCGAIETKSSIGGINIKKAILGSGLILVPCVNPDGCDISILGATACGEKLRQIEIMTEGNYRKYNANFRGVDINHNFDAGWDELNKKERSLGILGPAATRFGGYSPESEPETHAMCELCKTHNIRQVFALHSQGRVIYWSYGKKQPHKSRKIAEILATASGYALDYPISIAEGGGFKDWFIDKFDRPGFTIEIGKGENPLPIETAEKIYNEVKNMLTLSIIL